MGIFIKTVTTATSPFKCYFRRIIYTKVNFEVGTIMGFAFAITSRCRFIIKQLTFCITNYIILILACQVGHGIIFGKICNQCYRHGRTFISLVRSYSCLIQRPSHHGNRNRDQNSDNGHNDEHFHQCEAAFLLHFLCHDTIFSFTRSRSRVTGPAPNFSWGTVPIVLPVGKTTFCVKCASIIHGGEPSPFRWSLSPNRALPTRGSRSRGHVLLFSWS